MLIHCKYLDCVIKHSPAALQLNILTIYILCMLSVHFQTKECALPLQVVSILVQMYPMLRPDQVRERVFMSHNRREPFDQPLLLERCLRDIRNLFPRNPGDEFESQTQSSSSVATSYTTASFVVPRVSHLSPPARTSTVTRATITPSSAQMVSQPYNSITEDKLEVRRLELESFKNSDE